jgi:hypothetical protein
MTETTDSPLEAAVIGEALRLIDKSLSEMLHRELVSTDEVSDLLLDVRTLLTSSPGGDAVTGSAVTEAAPAESVGA